VSRPNHVTDLGALCNDVAYAVLNTQAQRVREQLLRINDDVTGHRLLRNAITPGSAVLRRLPDPAVLTRIAVDVAEIVGLALHQSIVRDRFTGTAVLTTAQAAGIGTLGYVARASGVSTDARYDHPSLPAPLPRPVPNRIGGDVLARFCIRAEEFAHSVATIVALVEALDGRTAAISEAPPPTGAAAGAGAGIVEGWRGTLVHRVELGPDGTLSRVSVVDPSFLNWPALPVAMAMAMAIVPDFPLANKSFNLSYAGNDL
jgi:Ni,Fe-hydrogenase III large subunit